jgi:hypothetical protein
MVSKVGDSQIIAIHLLPMYQGALVAMPRRLKHLQFPDMGASGGPPDGARVVHGTDEPTSYNDSS